MDGKHITRHPVCADVATGYLPFFIVLGLLDDLYRKGDLPFVLGLLFS